MVAAAAVAAESSTGTNVEVSTTDEFTKGVDALVYQIDEATEEMRIAYPLDLFDRNITDGRMMIVSFLTLVIGNNRYRSVSPLANAVEDAKSMADNLAQVGFVVKIGRAHV